MFPALCASRKIIILCTRSRRLWLSWARFNRSMPFRRIPVITPFRRVYKICEKWLLASSCLSLRPSVCPRGTTRFRLEGFSWNFVLQDLKKVYKVLQSLLQSLPCWLRCTALHRHWNQIHFGLRYALETFTCGATWLNISSYLLSCSMQQSPSWEAKSSSSSQEIPRVLWNPRFNTASTSARHLSYPEPHRSSPFPHILLLEYPS